VEGVDILDRIRKSGAKDDEVVKVVEEMKNVTQQIKYAHKGRRERKKDLGTFYLISAIYTCRAANSGDRN